MPFGALSSIPLHKTGFKKNIISVFSVPLWYHNAGTDLFFEESLQEEYVMKKMQTKGRSK